jgi:ribosomal protein S16
MDGVNQNRGVSLNNGKTNSYKNSGVSSVEAVSSVIITQGNGGAARLWRLFIAPVTRESENTLEIQYKKGSKWISAGCYIGERTQQ